MAKNIIKISDEQHGIINAFVKLAKNICIVAKAGCGKTTILKLLGLPNVSKGRKIFALAFNVTNKKDLERNLKGESQTLNGYGMSLLSELNSRRRNARLPLFKLNLRKDWDIVEKQFPELKNRGKFLATTAISLAKGLMYDEYTKPDKWISVMNRTGMSGVVNSKDEAVKGKLLALANKLRQCFIISVNQAIDEGWLMFEDQVYLPALLPTENLLGVWSSLCGMSIPTRQKDVVFIDEAQDLSFANIRMIQRTIKCNRMVVVGDPQQALYMFRGAAGNALDILKEAYNMETLPLSINFRCSRAVIANAQQYCDIRAREDAPDGEVSKLPFVDFDITALTEDSAVLSPINAPLFKLAIEAIKRQFAIKLSAKDIISDVKTALNSLPKLNGDSVDNWVKLQESEKGSLRYVNRGSYVADLAEVMKIIISEAAGFGGVDKLLNSLLMQNNGVWLSTGHKAKGLEWDNVYVLPFQHPDIECAKNVEYVIATRARQFLQYLVNSDAKDNAPETALAAA